jgi:hypothetical protein
VLVHKKILPGILYNHKNNLLYILVGMCFLNNNFVLFVMLVLDIHKLMVHTHLVYTQMFVRNLLDMVDTLLGLPIPVNHKKPNNSVGMVVYLMVHHQG